MFPFNWARVVSGIKDYFIKKSLVIYLCLLYFVQNAWMYLTIGLIFIVGSSLLMHMVFFAEEFMWVPRHTKDTLFISAVSYCCLC